MQIFNSKHCSQRPILTQKIKLRVKMIAEYFGHKIPTEIALGVIVFLLGMGAGISLMEKEKEVPQ
jgi:hypothetical protein